jgi:hypothetical protein
MNRWIILSLLGIFLATGVAAAQTATSPTTTSNTGAFDKLSPGNQKIARALYDAQTSKKLSTDDIAAMKQNGQGWGEVFRQMKSQGLLKEKNLGEVVSRSNRRGESVGNGGAAPTNESGKSRGVGNKEKSEGSTSSPRRGFKSDDSERGSSGARVGGNGHGNAFGRWGGPGGGPGHGRGAK